LPSLFAATNGRRIGEVWFEDQDVRDLPLLVKYIFTSERLSIQVHPTDRQAAAVGLPRGKEECWYILDCEPGATMGVGLIEAMLPERFRTAALDGSLEDYMDWKPVRPGDCYFIPAGTVHAIGAGISLVEVQQNSDITYRLYDYGRPRELHLDEGAPISRLGPYERPPQHAMPGDSARLVAPDEAPFALDLLQGPSAGAVALPEGDGPMWFTPIEGAGTIDGQSWTPGECWLLDPGSNVQIDSPASVLLATPR
jgi:mannose-6-phosphate isomerase